MVFPHGRSLHELATVGALPDHQLMDAATLDWITSHPPQTAADRPPIQPNEILLLLPDEAWFTNPRQAEGLHGIRHGARACVLAYLLATAYGLDRERTTALCVAAAVHDCRRLDDRSDPGHGRRGADWLTAHADLVLTALGCAAQVPPGLRGEAARAIAAHNLPYDSFPPGLNAGYLKAPHLVDLLKAADCMDRYRLPLHRWWPDTGQLRVPVPRWLPAFAHGLVVRSERAHLDGASHHQALTHALGALAR
ncbi:hypothetical protein [Streptomyces racemochromogenes]|uniref:hypothetical protein n=1 Tax=Streptomyces racemochromogenes TaxID=67353 RepID=UPI0031E7A734